MNKNKLRIGILLDDFNANAWTFRMIENIIQSDFAEIVLVVINDSQKIASRKSIVSKLKCNYGRITSLTIRKALDFIYSQLIERNTYLPDAHEEVCCKALLASTPTIKVKTKKKKFVDYFFGDDILTIKRHQIDIFVRCGFRVLKGDILKSAKYGIWSFYHGDSRMIRGEPTGFWESMENWPETSSTLEILGEDFDDTKVLFKSFTCTNALSIKDNRSNSYWNSLSFITRKMEELYNIGAEDFFKKVEYDNRHPIFYTDRLYTRPTNLKLAKLTLKKLKEKIYTLISNKVYLKQWILMFHLKNDFSSALWRYKKIIPPKDRFWADPHIIYRNNQYYIFLEELFYSTQKGHISLMIMDEDGHYNEPEIILEKPYHLSYPLVFEHNHEYYIIPESMANKTIELYKCTDFPNKWEFQMNLMENVKAVDATVLFYNGKWWMFANMIENEGASGWDELFLFSSDHLISNDWQPHPLNPIVSDCKNARPAGKIFAENGRLYRPSQNCSVSYGYGFNINEITVLDEKNYSETRVSSVKPNWEKNIIGTHTFNRVNSLHIIDAMYKRRRYGK